MLQDQVSTTSNDGDVFLSIVSSNFTGNEGSSVWCLAIANKISVAVNNSNFSDTKPVLYHLYINIGVSSVEFNLDAKDTLEIKFYRVQFNNNLISIPYYLDDIFGAVSIVPIKGSVIIDLHMVNFTSNKYTGYNGGAFAISLLSGTNIVNIHIEKCLFISNTSPGHGAALHIYTETGLSSYMIQDLTKT